MEMKFTAELIEWRGPAPFYYLPIPPKLSAEIKELSPRLTYGWGVIPVSVNIGEIEFTTSLFPKEGIYLVPVKKAVRSHIGLELGDKAKCALHFELK